MAIHLRELLSQMTLVGLAFGQCLQRLVALLLRLKDAKDLLAEPFALLRRARIVAFQQQLGRNVEQIVLIEHVANKSAAMGRQRVPHGLGWNNISLILANAAQWFFKRQLLQPRLILEQAVKILARAQFPEHVTRRAK